MNSKYFESLSSAYLAHFSRRMSDLIIEQGATVLRERQLLTPSTSISTILYLHTNKDVTAAMLADALGVTHQMATQRTNNLVQLGLVERIALPADKRSKIVRLTSLGKAEAIQLEPLLKDLKRVFDNLATEVGCDLVKTIRQTELSLQKTPLNARLNGLKSGNN